MSRFPTFYISHGGGPCFFMPDPRGAWTGLGNFLRDLPRSLSRRPAAILVVSAHWEESRIHVGAAARPELIYDYYGFPDYTYELEYPAAGAPAIAHRVGVALAEHGIDHVVDAEHGWDHGVFVPLKVMYPEAEVPIVAMSLRADLDPAHHIAVGQALESLRDDVVIIGSGSSFHNLSNFDPVPAQRFDDWLAETLVEPGPERQRRLNSWESAPGARAAHPREEHLLPLMVAVGAADDEPGQAVFRGPVLGVTMSCWRFGSH